MNVSIPNWWNPAWGVPVETPTVNGSQPPVQNSMVEEALPLPMFNSYAGQGEVACVDADPDGPLPLPSWPSSPARSNGNTRTPRTSPRLAQQNKLTENGGETALPIPVWNGFSEQPAQDGEGPGVLHECASGAEEALPLPNWDWLDDRGD